MSCRVSSTAAALALALASLAGCDGCTEREEPALADLARGGPSEGDLDGDGVNNAVDSDLDGDGVANTEDEDIDGDGTGNGSDDTPYGSNPDGIDGPWGDPDGDGQANIDDSDDNGDGVPDGVIGNGDCDGDGVLEDESADCDGYCINPEAGLLPCDDGSPPGTGTPDSDGDGMPDAIDPDDDADGIPDDGDHAPDGNDDPCLGIEAPPPASCLPETDDPPPPSPACSTETFDPQAPIPARILLVVDRSASMQEEAPGFGGNKWVATREALVGALFGGDGGVVGQLEDRVEMGLLTYPADDADDVCAPGALVRGVHLQNHSAIKTALFFTEPSGATPTAASLLEARDVLDALSADGGQRAVILATDGGPNCNRSLDGDTCRCVGDRAQCQQYSANCLDDVNTVAAASALSAGGYPVYVLGIDGAVAFNDVLTSIAQAGGTNDFFGVTSSSALAQTIENIATEVGSCRFDVAGLPDADALTVRIDGTVVAHDDARANGWDLVALSTLEFFGAACDAARAASTAITVERCQ